MRPGCSYHRQSLLSRSWIININARRNIHSSLSRLDLQEKYFDKLQKRADELGKTLEQLKQDVKVTKRPQSAIPEAAKLASTRQTNAQGISSSSSARDANARKDKSPVKPLGEIMDLAKILRANHTPDEVSVLWNAFHASRSSGTGRGYLSAAIPLATYNKMCDAARRYPTFVLPLPRDRDATTNASGMKKELTQDEAQRAFEFHFMEWAFHSIPPIPSIHSQDILGSSLPLTPTFTSPKDVASENPATSTILFTPLQAYKLHQSFATPHLVLTHYTDLAATHGLVLLRGEITPSTTSDGMVSSQSTGSNLRFRLSQQDAQLLALGVQRFYFAVISADTEGDGANRSVAERAKLLRDFHENSKAFDWERLLRHGDPTT